MRSLEAIGDHWRLLEAIKGQLRCLEVKYSKCTFIRYLRVLKIVCSNRKSGSNTFVDGLKQKVLYKNQGIYC